MFELAVTRIRNIKYTNQISFIMLWNEEYRKKKDKKEKIILKGT